MVIYRFVDLREFQSFYHFQYCCTENVVSLFAKFSDEVIAKEIKSLLNPAREKFSDALVLNAVLPIPFAHTVIISSCFLYDDSSSFRVLVTSIHA